jgi:hypothetical protein
MLPQKENHVKSLVYPQGIQNQALSASMLILNLQLLPSNGFSISQPSIARQAIARQAISRRFLVPGTLFFALLSCYA